MRDISKLVSSFNKWYSSDPHASNEDHYKDIITHENLSKLSRSDFTDFFYTFVAEGGKIQSGGDRQKNRFKETIEKNYESFKSFMLEPFQPAFNLDSWLGRVGEYKHFGFGSATIYLNRVDKNTYCIVNNKTKDALKKLGFEISTDNIKSYYETKKAQEELLKAYPTLKNFYKTDALNHYIIAIEEGRKIIETINSSDDWLAAILREHCPKERIDLRKSTEQELARMLAEKAGSMNREEWTEFFGKLNLDMWKGTIKKNRFGMAYAGQNINTMLADLDNLNAWTKRIWDSDEKNIVDIMMEYDGSGIKGAGIAYPTVVLYLKNPEKYTLMFKIMARGLSKQNGIEYEVSGLRDYERYNAAMNDFRDRHKLEPQTLDIIFSILGAGQMREGEIPVKVEADNSLNTILYGPPGSGKTYEVIEKAVKIIEGEQVDTRPTDRAEIVKRYNNYKEKGQIEFITFHQSYSYEEFVEGLRPVQDENNQISYEVEDGILKRICDKARVKTSAGPSKYDFDENKIKFFKMSLGNTQTDGDEIFEYCIQNNVIGMGYDGEADYTGAKTKEDVEKLYNEKHTDQRQFSINAMSRFRLWMNIDDIVIVSQGNRKVQAIGRITGDYFFDDKREIRFRHYRNVEWLYRDTIIPVEQIMKGKVFSQQTIYEFYTKDLNLNYIRSILSAEEDDETPRPHVLIIDEINRGNISKIFGELITLIEDDKRLGAPNELSVTLPYSKKAFGVPANLYILGTMNTADRSIALLDTALRRRFTFKEMMPDIDVLREKSLEDEDIDMARLLETINDRIEYLYDRDHTIGHAYFINLKSFEELRATFRNKIFPLLQEYFYNDWEKIALVLNDHRKGRAELKFVTNSDNGDAGTRTRRELFGSVDLAEYDEKKLYRLNEDAFNEPEAYKQIYEIK
jgi:5-methylcytosine-specific restriction protein B